MSFGIFAFSLIWLTTIQAALVALCALVFNRFLLPHVGGKFIARREMGWDSGIVIYPMSVLVVILVFYDRPWLAAAVWCILAFGDGLATIVGHNVPIARLPWNPDKSVGGSLAFVVAAGLMAWLALVYVGAGRMPEAPSALWLAFGTVLVCAVVESLPTGVDDNLSVPLVGSITIAILSVVTTFPEPLLKASVFTWLIVNVVLSVAGFLVKSVNASGLIGGILLGSVIIMFGGWELYVVLLGFFVSGTSLTKWGYAEKSAKGLAQEEGGRRSFSHAFANVGVAAIVSLLIGTATFELLPLWLAAAGSLVTALADTAASETGQLFGRRTFMPLTLERVPTGTEGAVSIEGTLGGMVAAAVLSLVAAALSRSMHEEMLIVFAICLLAGVIGSWIESIAGSVNRRLGGVIANGALNFFNTMVGAAIAYGLGRIWVT